MRFTTTVTHGSGNTSDPSRITLERSYTTSIEKLWALWTTKEGIESWWGPEGFEVTVNSIDLRPGGGLDYTMTATGPDQIAFMKSASAPLSTDTMVTYLTIEAPHKLEFSTLADFIPDVAPYDVTTTLEFVEAGDAVTMRLTFDVMHDDLWTERSRMGEEMQLAKLDALLAG
jgi:uncharacterized protein YndB with AHSA1/START domain